MTDAKSLAEKAGYKNKPHDIYGNALDHREGDAYLAGFKAALECEEVRDLRWALKKVDDWYVDKLSVKHCFEFRAATEAFDRLAAGGEK